MVRIGSALIESGEIAEGITMVEKGLDAAEALGKKKTVADAFKALVDAHERTGAYDKALRYLREHLRITAEIQSDETKRQLHQMEARKQIEIERLRNTELAGALAQLKAAQTQLVQSEKMASLGELTAGIAHEINNPINFVRANISPLRRDIDELRATLDAARQIMSPEQRRELQEVIDEREIDAVDAEIDALLDGIQEGARRTADIVAGLRSFSRLDEDELKPVDLHEGLDATINLLGSKLDGRIAISRSYSELPAVECYPGQINQVFMNIIGNAIDAIEAEGTIAIATTADDQTVNIAITDSGMGIAPEHLERIFEPFFTTKEIGKGTGLGLAICHGIVTKHGGDISVTSTPTVGTTFTLTLPLSFPPSPRPAVPPSPPPTHPLSS
jgi:signal transduction histidine kinase